MGVPESVFSLGPWDESGNPFTMSTVRPFLRVTRVHSGARPPNAPTELSLFTVDAATHRRDTPRHPGSARARSRDGPTARPTGSDRRIREPLRGGSATFSPITNVLQSPSQKVDGSAVDRSLYYGTARRGRAGVGHRPFSLRVERRDSRYHKGEGAGPGAVLGLAPTSH